MRHFRIVSWHVVLLGILLNVISAVITNAAVDARIARLDTLTGQQDELGRRISELWRNIQDTERKRDHFIVLLSQAKLLDAPLSAEVQEEITRTLNTYQWEPPPNFSSPTLKLVNGVFQRYQKNLRDEIDNTYLEIVNTSSRVSPLKVEISRYRNLALFLQILGLMFVVARDLPFFRN